MMHHLNAALAAVFALAIAVPARRVGRATDRAASRQRVQGGRAGGLLDTTRILGYEGLEQFCSATSCTTQKVALNAAGG